MNTRHIIAFALTTSVLAAHSIDAAIVVNAYGGHTTGASWTDTGTITSDGTAGTFNSAQLITYTFSGLTIDNTGSGDDVVEVSFMISGTAVDGTTIQFTTDGDEMSGGPNKDFWEGEQIFITFQDIVVNLSGGSDNGVGTYLGIDRLQFGARGAGTGFRNNATVDVSYGATTVTLNGTSSGLNNDGLDGLLIAPATTGPISILVTDRGANSPDASFRDYEFAFTADVPEPSTLALLGMGGLLVARRRCN